jgi:tetratricopeptide (TPR) repeat protein
MAARHAGDAPRAAEIFTELIRQYPHNTWAYMSLGVTYKQMGQPERAIGPLRKVLEIDPLHKEAYNQLAYAYEDAGDLDNAIWAINEYIEMAPDEANPYDSRGDLYAFSGKLDEALESYRKASEVKPLFSIDGEGAIYLFRGEYAKAESCYSVMAKSDDSGKRSHGRMMLATVPMYQGMFEKALRILEDGIAADRMEQYIGTAVAGKHRLMALIRLEMEDFDAAIPAARRCMEARAAESPNDPAYVADFYISTLCLTGHVDEAEDMVAPIVKRYAERPEGATQFDFLLLGLLEYGRGNLEDAIRYMEQSIDAGDPFLHLRVIAARFCIEAGELGRAVGFLEAALQRYDRVRAITPIWSVKGHYLLGLAYEGSGWKSKAVDQYETFLDIWKDADPGIPALVDARRRLEGLKQEA